MTISEIHLDPQRQPRYLALADAVENAIDAGTIGEGVRLPPQRELAYKVGVTVGTVGRAYDLLAQRGLVRGEVGRGTFVIGRGSHEPPETLCPPEREGQTELSTNQPVFSSIQPRLANLLEELASDHQTTVPLMAYSPFIGYARHREAIAQWLQSMGAPADAQQVTLTCGAQSALSTVLLALTRPGDTILVQRLTYGGLRLAAEAVGLHFDPLEYDDEGILPASLEAAARHRRGTLLFLDSNLNNPTSTMTSPERRRVIADIARHHDLKILEDDVYGPLLRERPDPVAALAPERTVYVSSASKFLAPGIRLGIIASPTAFTDRIAATCSHIALSVPTIMAELFIRAIQSGLVDDAMRTQSDEVRRRQLIVREVLGHLPMRQQMHSLHVWLELPRPWTGQECHYSLPQKTSE